MENAEVALHLKPGQWKTRLLWKENFILWGVALVKIPLLFFLRPRILEASPERNVIKISLRRRSQNHLDSMYFGAICVGVDAAGGFLAHRIIREKKARASIIFKDIHGNFLKRIESDAYFVCKDAAVIRDMIDRALSSRDRINEPIAVTVYTKGKTGFVEAANFTTTLSVKPR